MPGNEATGFPAPLVYSFECTPQVTWNQDMLRIHTLIRNVCDFNASASNTASCVTNIPMLLFRKGAGQWRAVVQHT